VALGSDDNELTLGPAGVATRSAESRRFAPGSVIAGRYRVIALLGKGGMGEVYRAEDLTLDQQVALKFLPERADQHDPAALAQFHNELRVARQVSHKNVCRLYDIGEADGRRFLTMEYVDGEDLASLLRRIGRLPSDKAIEIARQICAGVAAAHDRGVLHRDLKPANVMLDGDGHVRITDFGLALRDGEASAAFAGTPHYMAPEQLAGSSASTKSDIYALGLVLFEIFTGRRAYDAKTLHELKALHDSGSRVAPSSIVRDLDPAVERVIERCLDRDPARRPTSALAVAASLPGGDPLAEALAAGETPSPDLLVAAGEREALGVGWALVAVVGILGGLASVAALAPRVTFVRLVPLDKPPAALADRAEQLLNALGYDEPRGDTADGFQLVADYIDWIARTDTSAHRWDQLASGTPAAMSYWYRTSPRDLVPRVMALRPTQADPPPALPGMHAVVMDTRGQLIRFDSVPPQLDTAPTANIDLLSWSKLFDAAGLAFAAFTPVAPQWTPRDFADTRHAWEGPLSDTGTRVRVEAAAFRNRVTAFRVIGPWTRPTVTAAPVRPLIDRIQAVVVPVSAVLLTLVSALLARHNLRARRADVASATKLALAAFVIEMLMWVLGYHHASDTGAEITSLTAIASDAGFVALALWLNYTAFEPYCRRFWPDMLLGWTRLFSGRVRDPRVGRDVLAGIAAGVGWLLIDLARRRFPLALGHPPILMRLGGELTFTGTADAVRVWSVLFDRALLPAFGTVLMLVLLRLLTKRPRLAIALTGVLLLWWWSAFGPAPVWWIEATAEVATVALYLFAMIRFGLLSALVAYFVSSVCQTMPLTLDIRHWSATGSNQTIAMIVALTLFAFYAARAGRPLLGFDLTAFDAGSPDTGRRPARTP
jgi:serine/threonine-protein kinase